MVKYENKINSVMEIFKALSDENRVRALSALQHRELCLCQIIELFGLAPSTVSKHMSLLKRAGLVASRKDGRWIYYRLPDETSSIDINRIIQWVNDVLLNDQQIHDDQNNLKKILLLDPEVLCKKQCKK